MNEEITKEELEDLLIKMMENWPSEFIARKKVEEFTGGMITGKTVANFEADKTKVGPPKFKIGAMSGYPKRAFIQWLKKRIVVKNKPVFEIVEGQN